MNTVKLPAFLAGIPVQESESIQPSSCFRADTWEVPKSCEAYKVGEEEYVLNLGNNEEGFWFGTWAGQRFGAAITYDLVGAAKHGNFHEAIVPPIIKAAGSLWSQGNVTRMGFVFRAKMGEMDWDDIFKAWMFHTSKHGEFIRLESRSLKTIDLFAGSDMLGAFILLPDESLSFKHRLGGPGVYFKGQIKHPSLGILNSNMQYGPLVIADGLFTAEGADPTEPLIYHKTGLGPHLFHVMTGIVHQIKFEKIKKK